MDIQQITLFKQIMKEAGTLLLSFWAKPIIVMKKGTSVVTQADRTVEEFLIARLSKLFPEANFLAEESGFSGDISYVYQWVIDPLDGTRNFARHIPYFCISVALTHYDNPVMAAVYNPLLDELFFAQKGQGATCNDSPIQVSNGITFEQSVIVARSFFRDFVIAHDRAKLLNIARQVAGVRHLGAIALDLVYVAAGRFDGIIFNGLAWWDIAAGLLIMTEAGGQIADLNGSLIMSRDQNCVAGGSPVFDHLYQNLKD